MIKRLYKSSKDKKIFGICAGVAEYYDIDPTIVRAAVLFVDVITGVVPGLFAYLLLGWIIPEAEEVKRG